MENYKRSNKNNNIPEPQSNVANSNNYLDDIEASLNNINQEFFNAEAPRDNFMQPATRSNSHDSTGLSLKDILESKGGNRVAPRPQPETHSRRQSMPSHSSYQKQNNEYQDEQAYKRQPQPQNNVASSYREDSLQDPQPMRRRNAAPQAAQPSTPWLSVQEDLNRDTHDTRINPHTPYEEVPMRQQEVRQQEVPMRQQEVRQTEARQQGVPMRRQRPDEFRERQEDFASQMEAPRTNRSHREADYLNQSQNLGYEQESMPRMTNYDDVQDFSVKQHPSQAVEQDDIDDLLNKIRTHNLKQGTRTDADTRMAILRKMASTGNEPGSLDFEAEPTRRHNKALEDLVESIEKDVDLSQPSLREMELNQERMMFGDSGRSDAQRQNVSSMQQLHNTQPVSPVRSKTDELPVLQVGLDSKEAHAMVDTLNLTNLALVEKTQELAIQLHEYEEDLEYMEGNLQRTNRLIVILLVLFVLLIIILGVYTFKTLL